MNRRKVDRGPRPVLSRWPLINEEEWCKVQKADFIQGLDHAFRYVQGKRMVVLNSGPGFTAGLLAAKNPTAKVVASDLECRSTGTRQMAEMNNLPNLEFTRKQDDHGVDIENYFDCALLLDVVNAGPRATGLIGAAARAARPGGRVILVTAESAGRPFSDALPEIEIRRRINQAGLETIHRTSASGYGIYVAVK